MSQSLKKGRIHYSMIKFTDDFHIQNLTTEMGCFNANLPPTKMNCALSMYTTDNTKAKQPPRYD